MRNFLNYYDNFYSIVIAGPNSDEDPRGVLIDLVL